MTGLLAIDLNPFDNIVDFISSPFEAAAGWAWDTVIGGTTNWLAKGFVQLVTFVWTVMDATTSPTLTAEWFSRSAGAPYVTAIGVAAGVLVMVLLAALIQGVMQGRPMDLIRRMFRDAPIAVAGILFTVAFAQVGIDLTDAIANDMWGLTRGKAVNAVDGLLLVSEKLPSDSFLAPLMLLVGMIAMLMLWITLLVRQGLIYLVVALCPLAWATSVWPALASVKRRALELLAGLIVSKLAIALALAVGLGALGGVGGTGNPGDGVIANGLAEYGTLMTGIIVFGLAAFMPFLVIKMIPIVEAAVIAQGIHSAPVRTAMQGMQYSYYLQGISNRLAGGAATGGAGGAGTSGSGSGSAGGESSGMGAPASARTQSASSSLATQGSAVATGAVGAGTATTVVRRAHDTTAQTAAAPIDGPSPPPGVARPRPRSGDRDLGGEP